MPFDFSYPRSKLFSKSDELEDKISPSPDLNSSSRGGGGADRPSSG